jgi:hypothetical protein
MRKIRLELDRLSVESFEVQPTPELGKGTVEGYASANQTNCLRCSNDAICTLGVLACTPSCPP